MSARSASASKPLPRWRPSTLASMTFVELLRLKRALEGSEGMVVDGCIYTAVMDVLWDRHGVPTRTWPTSKTDGGIHVVHFCDNAGVGFKRDELHGGKGHLGHKERWEDHWPLLAPGPDDPEHRPVRRLKPSAAVAASGTLGDLAGGWGQAWYECSCGKRDGDSRTSGTRATGRAWRCVGEPGGWVRSDSADGRRLGLDVLDGMLLVCPRAKGPDDRRHALYSLCEGLFSCVCGTSVTAMNVDKVQQIPVPGGQR